LNAEKEWLDMSAPLPMRTLLLASPVVACAHIAFYYPQLPERVASHFGPNGVADGWMPKEAFAIFYVALMAFMAAIFGGISALLRHTPNDLINLPNKEYWLAPERREETIRGITESMASFGVATTVLLIAVMQSVILANINGTIRLGNVVGYYLVAYLAYTLIWTVNLIRRYSVPK
jgi:uncharacterized membrane protein